MTLLDIIEIYNMKTGRKIDDIGSLYEDIDIDARIDKEILVGSLLDECGAMNCLYDTTATFKYFSNNFFKKYKWNITKLLDTLELKYDPLTNKNVKWTETTKIEQDLDTAESQSENRGRSTSEEDSERNTGSVKNNYSDNEENKISAMNANDYEPDNERKTGGENKREDDLRRERNGSSSEHIDTSKDRNKSENLAWDEIDTHTESGTNDVLYQDLIEKERKVAQFSIYNWISKKYAKELFLLVY